MMLSSIRRNRFSLIVFLLLFCLSYVFIRQKQAENKELLEQFKAAQSTVPPELFDNIRKLKEKLEVMKYENNVRVQELNDLRLRLQSQMPLNLTEGLSLSLPSIYNYLPHLMVHKDALTPAVRLSKDRRGVALAFGIPTAPRPHQSYLVPTIQSLVNGLTDEEKKDVVLIVLIAHAVASEVRKLVAEISSKFPSELESGLLEVIAPPPQYYPDMSRLKLTFHDTADRVRWRTKQNLDYAFLMMYAMGRGIFYVQLEDDIIATPGYASTMKTFAMQQASNDWLLLEFSSLGFIGKLFRSSDLGMLADFFLMFHRDKPIDWLLDHIMYVKACNPEKDNNDCVKEKSALKISFRPSLFQHVGKESSLKGKVQTLEDKEFRRAPLFTAHLNPKARIVCTFEEYLSFKATSIYIGQNFFWAVTPKKDNEYRIIFEEPQKLKSYLFRTGNAEHPGDILQNTTVEVLTIQMQERRKKINIESGIEQGDSYPVEDYQQIGVFDWAGLATGVVSSRSAEISEMRLRVLESAKSTWAIISEIHIETLSKS